MKIRTPKTRLSPSARDRWKKLAPAMAVFVAVTLAAAFLYGRAGRTSNVEVYALGAGVSVAEGDVFDGEFLRVVEIPADGTLLAGLVPVSEGALAGVFTALRDLPAGAMLRNTDYIAGTAAPDVGPQAEDENWITVDVPLEWGVSEQLAGLVDIPEGNIWVVTDTIPRRHVACVQFGGEVGTSEALVHPKDLPPLLMWMAAGRARPVQQTTDECPLGGMPRLCGILTNALDPADALTEEERRGGFVFAEELPAEPGELPVVKLPECRVDDGAGVFDRPGDLTKEFCSKISLEFLNRIGVEASRLEACGEEDETGQNPDEAISDLSEAEVAAPDGAETEAETEPEAEAETAGEGADAGEGTTAAAGDVGELP